eukprot:1960961-Rhodomonas_salina.2
MKRSRKLDTGPSESTVLMIRVDKRTVCATPELGRLGWGHGRVACPACHDAQRQMRAGTCGSGTVT